MSDAERALRVDSPCDNRWEDLEPREGGRWCAQCRRVVVDLMSVTEAEAWRAVDAAGGDLCARIRPGPDGDAEFRAAPRRASKVAAIALGAALAACEASGSTAPSDPAERPIPIQQPPAPPPVESETTPDEAAPTAEAATDEDPTAETDTVEPTDDDADDDHAAHPGQVHTAIHERRHGRMGGVSVRPRDEDPLEGLDL